MGKNVSNINGLSSHSFLSSPQSFLLVMECALVFQIIFEPSSHFIMLFGCRGSYHCVGLCFEWGCLMWGFIMCRVVPCAQLHQVCCCSKYWDNIMRRVAPLSQILHKFNSRLWSQHICLTPVFSRNAELTIKYMTQSIQYSNVSTKIILIEYDDDSKLEDLTLQPLVEYIFLPKTIAYFWGCGDLFPNSLLKNIAYLLSKKAKWIIFHDIDIAVPKDFLINAWSAKTANRWMYTYLKFCRATLP